MDLERQHLLQHGGDLVVGDEADQGLGVGGAPALDRHHLVGADPLLVGGDRARRVVAVVDGLELQRAAGDAAVLVDPGHRVGHALAVGLAHVGGRAGEVDQVADEDRVRGGGGTRPEDERRRRQLIASERYPRDAPLAAMGLDQALLATSDSALTRVPPLQKGQTKGPQLLAQQQGFHREASSAYTQLASAVGASLQESLAASARQAGHGRVAHHRRLGAHRGGPVGRGAGRLCAVHRRREARAAGP